MITEIPFNEVQIDNIILLWENRIPVMENALYKYKVIGELNNVIYLEDCITGIIITRNRFHYASDNCLIIT